MIAQNRIGKFLKIYLVFLASALLVNVSSELLIGSPGWGIVSFYMLFSFVGSAVFLWTKLKSVSMGGLSLIAGWGCELTFMQPGFLQDVYALRIDARLLVTLAVTTLYWFAAWGVPAYILHRFSSRR